MIGRILLNKNYHQKVRILILTQKEVFKINFFFILENEELYSVGREKSLIGCFDVFKQSLNDCFKCQAVN
jgi:hypothetical protein